MHFAKRTVKLEHCFKELLSVLPHFPFYILIPRILSLQLPVYHVGPWRHFSQIGRSLLWTDHEVSKKDYKFWFSGKHKEYHKGELIVQQLNVNIQELNKLFGRLQTAAHREKTRKWRHWNVTIKVIVTLCAWISGE